VKLLFDSCMSPRDAAAVARAGHDAVWVGTWPADPGDREILRRAREDSRVVVTLDSDFSRLVFSDRMHHAGIIWLRNVSPLDYAEKILQALGTFAEDLQHGLIVVITPTNMRSRSSIADLDA
jgi:predicted nuclease of predicted toxin-antitoxin system